MTRAVTLAEIADTNTFVVDGTNVRVGINSSIPTTTLDVDGAVKATSFTGNITGNATGLTGTPDIAVRNITGVAATFTGLLTYEDVTNIDSVGIVTARTGVRIADGGLIVTAGVSTFAADISIADKIIHTSDTNTAIRFPANDTFSVETAGSEAARFDSSGRLLMGRTTSQNDNIGGIGYANLVQIEGSATGSGLAVSNTGGTARININREYTPSNGDDLAYLSFGAETTSVERARITCAAEFTNANTRGGRLIFSTCADSAHDPTERLRIDSSGKVGVNINNPGSYNSAGNEIVLGNTGSNGGMTIVSGTGNNGHIFFADGTGTPNQGIIKYEHANDAMAFNTNTGERLRILSGGGITFNGDSATANALDDYEEGTWTPTPQFGGNSVSMTGSFSGRYTKIGNLVTVSYALTFTAKGSSTGDFRIPNLPYSNGITGLNDSGFSYLHRLNAAQTNGQLYVNVGGTIATFRWPGYGGGNSTIVQNGDLVDSTAISGFVSYQI